MSSPEANSSSKQERQCQNRESINITCAGMHNEDTKSDTGSEREPSVVDAKKRAKPKAHQPGQPGIVHVLQQRLRHKRKKEKRDDEAQAPPRRFLDPNLKAGLRHGRPRLPGQSVTSSVVVSSAPLRHGLAGGFSNEKFRSTRTRTLNGAAIVNNGNAASFPPDGGQGQTMPDQRQPDPAAHEALDLDASSIVTPDLAVEADNSSIVDDDDDDMESPPLISATLVEDHDDERSNRNANEIPAEVIEARPVGCKDHLCNRNILCAMGILILVFIAVVAGLAATNANSSDGDGLETTSGTTTSSSAPSLPSPTASPTASPTTAPLESILPDELFDRLDLNDTSLPQTQAYEWLSNHPDANQIAGERKLQLFALATFYFATQGDKWGLEVLSDQQTKWLDYTTNECSWAQSDAGPAAANGPVCDSAGRLQRLRLNRLDVRGTIPPELSLLSEMISLRLDDNYLQGTFPWLAMTKLTKLTQLDLHGNDLEGSISRDLSALTSLSFLDLHANDLTGSIFDGESFGTMTNMTFLALNSNDMTGPIPKELGMLTQLSVLLLSSNMFTGTLPTTIGQLTQLDRFKMVENHVTGEVPSELGLLVQLTDLAFNRNRLEGGIPSELGLLTVLESLGLLNNTWTGEVPTELGSLTLLSNLFLHDNELLGGTVPTELCNNNWGDSAWGGLHVDCKRVNCTCDQCQCHGVDEG